MAKRERGPERVSAALLELGIAAAVEVLPASTRTASEAAQAIGCKVGQIAKSLLFNVGERGACLVIVSGSQRASLSKLGQLLGEPVELATPDFVRKMTGFSIGGVPPVGLAMELPVYIDETLMDESRIWAAAGSPHAVMGLEPKQLLRISGGQIADVVE